MNHKRTFFLDGSVSQGVFKGVLRIRGEGDPNISARFYPEPLYLLHAMADSLKELGIDSLVGKIELDTSFYSGPRKPLYWAPHFYNAWY
ncbi:MAG: D-alanyl-D-alanine carboxypeptidase, partial [Fibrobacteraceae bacterium]|nr:D-alanyl-D-alanine carboxypeptidase [Fibrobacteraceae bacterium]